MKIVSTIRNPFISYKMNLSDCKLGINAGPLSLEIISRSNLTEELLKLVLIDASQAKVNLFVEGANLINFFMQPRISTRLELSDFEISEDFTQISQHFPTYLNGEEIATHETSFRFYIRMQNILPKLTLGYLNRTLKVSPSDNLDHINVKELYELRKSQLANIEKVGGTNKCCTLKEISDKISGNTVYAWCYAVVVDCCSSYLRKQGESPDYIAVYRITDYSIFPNNITLTIFHKTPKELPKIANFGDIIKLNDVQFKEHQGSMVGTFPSNTKSMSFYLFDYSGESLSPYACYKGQFHTNAEHANRIERLSDWTRLTFAYEVPLFLSNTKTLASLSINEEADVKTRVVEICSLGVNEHDPSVVILADSNEICQLVVPFDRKRLLKFIKQGDLVRIRGVSYEEKVLILKPYSEILRIPPEFKCLDVPNSLNKEELAKFLKIYVDIPQSKVISVISSEFQSVPMIPFNKLLVTENKFIKVEGFIIKLCIKRNSLELTLWEGNSEDNLISISVPEETIKSFLNGKSWEQAQLEAIGHDCKFQGIIQKDPNFFRLVGTSLV
jgi:hypothetical protein